MRNWTKSLKWTAGASMLLVMLMAVQVVQGGGRFSGIDPEVLVNEEKFNVYIEWSTDDMCLIDGLIDVNFWYPSGTNTGVTEAELVMESDASFPCDHSSNSSLIDENGNIHVVTKTNLKAGTESDPNQGGILVTANVNASEQMPFTVYVYHNSPGFNAFGKPVGNPVRVCEGFSGEFVFCDPYQFNNNNNDNNDNNDDDDD